MLTGAGGGIGTAIALKLADEGCNLVLSDRDAASLERTQAACAQRGGFALRILAVRADLSNRDDVARLAKEAATAFGAPLDFLVNNGALCLLALLCLLGADVGGAFSGGDGCERLCNANGGVD